jgi:hypothetical protein
MITEERKEELVAMASKAQYLYSDMMVKITMQLAMQGQGELGVAFNLFANVSEEDATTLKALEKAIDRAFTEEEADFLKRTIQKNVREAGDVFEAKNKNLVC